MDRRSFIGALVAAVFGTSAAAGSSSAAGEWGVRTTTDVDAEAGTVYLEVANSLDTYITPTVRVSAGGDDTGLVTLPKAESGTTVSKTIDVSEFDVSKGVTADLSLW